MPRYKITVEVEERVLNHYTFEVESNSAEEAIEFVLEEGDDLIVFGQYDSEVADVIETISSPQVIAVEERK